MAVMACSVQERIFRSLHEVSDGELGQGCAIPNGDNGEQRAAYVWQDGKYKRCLIPTAESSDPPNHAVQQDASVWAKVNTFAGWYYIS